MPSEEKIERVRTLRNAFSKIKVAWSTVELEKGLLEIVSYRLLKTISERPRDREDVEGFFASRVRSSISSTSISSFMNWEKRWGGPASRTSTRH